MAKENGSFGVRGVTDGSYHLTVDAGKDYEITEEKLHLIDTGTKRLGQTITVGIQLRPKTAPINNTHTLDGAVANVPSAAQELHARALVAARAKDHKKAIELLTKALALYPDFA